MKHKSTKYYKAQCDRLFSLFIRQRDADGNGYCKCCTCGKLKSWRYLDCGHFIGRQHSGTRYDEKNSNAQCKECNNKDWNQGEQFLHGRYIDNKYGLGTADKLNTLSKMECNRGWFDYSVIAQELLEKLKQSNYEIR